MSYKLEFDSRALAFWLRDRQMVLGRWRLKFYEHMRLFHEFLGAYIKVRMKSYIYDNWYDTGTLHKRVDYKVTFWNRIVFGIFEHGSRYYESEKHDPTLKFMWIYRNFEPDPTQKKYAGFINERDPFFMRIIIQHQSRLTKKEVDDFMRDHPII